MGLCVVLKADDEYMISDDELSITKYISVPREMGSLNCNAFMAGIIQGVLEGAGFPARYVFLCAFMCVRKRERERERERERAGTRSKQLYWQYTPARNGYQWAYMYCKILIYVR